MKELIAIMISAAMLVATVSTEAMAREWTYPPPQGEYTTPRHYTGPGRYNSGQGPYATPRHYQGPGPYQGPGRYNSGQGEYRTPRHYDGPGRYAHGPGQYRTPRHYHHRVYGSMYCRAWRGDWCPVWVPTHYHRSVIVLDVPVGYYGDSRCSGGLVGLLCVTIKGVNKALDFVLFGAFQNAAEERDVVANVCGETSPCKIVCEDANRNGRNEPSECRKLTEE